MLKKYMPYNLLMEEAQKRDYFLSKVEKDNNWKGGEMQIPFFGGKASSRKFGGLTAEADIVEDRPVLGTLSDYKELWGSMVFNDSDLARHGDMETSFLKILPDRLDDFIGGMKELVSVNLLNGPHIASYDSAAAANDLVNGVIVVDRPARLSVGQFVEFGVVGGSKGTGYIEQINMEDKSLLINLQKDLAGPVVDLSGTGINVLAGDKVFVEGAITAGNAFTDLRSQHLSLANGGSAALFGQTKLAYPHLQAYNYDGAGVDASNILAQLFDFYTETRTIGKGNPTDAIMSYKHLGSIMKALETNREYSATDTRANVYGWTEIDIVGVKGRLTVVGVQEMDDDIIHLIDWKTLKLHSNGMFERRTSPEGRQFYETRSTSGYQYIVDTRFFGDLVAHTPSHNGIMHTIDY
jgi:hypothetical protein